MTHFHADFIDYVECNINVKNISKLDKIIGFGTTLHKFIAMNNDLLSYHHPSTDVHLLSPQANHQLHGGSSELDGDKVLMNLRQQSDTSIGCDVTIPIKHHQSNLPIVTSTACTKKELGMMEVHYGFIQLQLILY